MQTDLAVRKVGAPVQSVNWIRVFPTIDKEANDCLVAVMGQQADNLFVVKIDPNTGTCRQFNAGIPESNYPTAAMLSRDGLVYIGAAHSGHLFVFDPKDESLTDLGPINLPDDIFPCRIDEDLDGTLWIGCYGSAGLTSYEPSSGVFTRHGRMDEVDMYCYPLAASDGTVACDIKMTTPHVVVFDPATGIKRAVGPAVTKEDGGTCTLIRGVDGLLYIEASEGNFRIDGFDAVPLDVLPEPERPPAMTNGSTVSFTDADVQKYRTIGITDKDGQLVRELYLEYEAAGSSLFLVHEGPGKRIYGSSILPLHLFECDPATEEMADLGQCSTATGEVYSMGNLDGKLYMCSYPAGKLSIYDPSRPYKFGTEEDSNPRDVGRMDDVSYRPRCMVTGPLGRVWTASVPDYGIWGGPLSWYDPSSGAFGSYRDIAGEASCWSLAWLEEQEVIAVGTTIQGGSGTQPRVDEATLFLWDYTREHKTWEGSPDGKATSLNALVQSSDGRLFGTFMNGDGDSGLFVFDPGTRRFVSYVDLPTGSPLEGGLFNGPGDMIYGYTRSVFYRLDPESLEITNLVHEEDGFHVPGPIIDGKAYFARVHEIYSLDLDTTAS